MPPDAREKLLHDINNTLGSLIINVEVIADSPAADDLARDAARAALGEIRKLEEQIAALQDL